MGTSKINIWITELGNPCKMSSRTWAVAILHCDGTVLEWCGKKYDSIIANCGHVEIEVPPGCYRIIASAHTWWYGGILYGNWKTDSAVVQACCDETHCVTLYDSSFRGCWYPIAVLIERMVHQRVFSKNALEAMKTIQNEMDKLPMPNALEAEVNVLKRHLSAMKEEKKKR